MLAAPRCMGLEKKGKFGSAARPGTCYPVCTMVRRPPAALLLAVGVLAAGCLSPTLPLPPPEVPTQQMVDSTHVTLTSGCGGVQNNAQVQVLNSTEAAPGGGMIGVVEQATSCGSWSGTIFARTGDTLQITQQTNTQDGLPRIVHVGTP